MLMLEDDDFLGGIEDLIRENHLTAEKAFEFKALEVRDAWAGTAVRCWPTGWPTSRASPSASSTT
jgi:hypothetical protein